MSSQSMMYKITPNRVLNDTNPQTSALHTYNLTFHAEKHGGTHLSSFAAPRFICQRLHVFELSHSDIKRDKWCVACKKTNAKTKKALYNVSAGSSSESIAVSCACGKQYVLALAELKKFKGCTSCAPSKNLKQQNSDDIMCGNEISESALKIQENSFIETYRRLVEAFPLIRKLPTQKIVELYFEREIFNAPVDLQPNCLAVHLIAEQKAFVRAIFERLNEQLKRKFCHKILSGIAPVLKIDPRTSAVFEFVKSLVH